MLIFFFCCSAILHGNRDARPVRFIESNLPYGFRLARPKTLSPVAADLSST